MFHSRRSAIALIAVVTLAVALSSVSATSFKFMVGNAEGNDIDLVNPSSHRLSNLVSTSAGLIKPDTMLRIPGKDRFLVSSGEELAESAIMIVNSNNGRVIGRFDDGTF